MFRPLFLSLMANFAFLPNSKEKQLQQLKAENLQLKFQIQKIGYLIEENKRLKKIIAFQQEKDVNFLPVRVIGIKPSRFQREILVAGGREYGLGEGMVVVDDNGFLVGKIKRVYTHYSSISLVSDPDFTATVKIGNYLGLLEGTLSGDLKVSYIENDKEIQEGDDVWLVSYDYNVQIFVGKVKQVREDKNSLFLNITVHPFCKPYALGIVFVLGTKGA